MLHLHFKMLQIEELMFRISLTQLRMVIFTFLNVKNVAYMLKA